MSQNSYNLQTPNTRDKSPLLLAVTGASGSVYSLCFLELMKQLGQQTALIISQAGKEVICHELGRQGLEDMKALASCCYDASQTGAKPASGSARWRAMVILPCTMGTLGAVANGISANLIHRAADCFLKERRPLVLVPRETPLNRVHLKNMLAAQEAGAVIYPAMPSFYHRPESVEDMARFLAGRIAELLGFHVRELKVWTGK
jgi:4-hydroxy-3-polyprenylbenzoate decarboxylase